jgi:hydrogenase maturation protease
MGLSVSCDGPSILVIGLGNELLSDDGVGIRVLHELKGSLPADDAAFLELSVGGLQLLDHLVGYRCCFLIDAVVTGTSPAGTVHRFVQEPGGAPIRLSSSHHVDLSQVLRLGTMLGAIMPEKVTVYGIEPEDTTTFSERCTGKVAEAIPRLVELIRKDVKNEVARSRGRGSEQSLIEHSATH